jgi:hypothetical protein
MKFSIRERSSMGDTKMKLSPSFELQIRCLFLMHILTVQLHDKVNHLAKNSPNIMKLNYQIPCLQQPSN